MSKKILIVGDSLSKGVVYDDVKNKYVIIDDCFFNLLSNTVNADMVNASHFGSTVTDGKKNLEAKMKKHNPDIVVIEFGGNDCDFYWDEIADNPVFNHMPKTPLDKFESQINSMVDYIEKNGKKAVLTTLPPLYADNYFNWFTGKDEQKGIKILKWLKDIWRIYWWHERYSSCISAIANKRNVYCIDIRNAFLKAHEFRQYICKDGIHPNRAGHHLIFDTVIGFIKENAPFLLPAYC